jgi:quercetin dioxygenase-like cupin family protein
MSPSGKHELPPAQVIDLISIFDYLDGAVISRTLLKYPSGSITLFAFDEGQGLSEHTATSDALVHLLEGTAEIFVSGTRLTAKSGDAILLPANQPHALKALTKFKMLLTMIHP